MALHNVNSKILVGQRWKVSDERFGTRETKMNRAIRLWELKVISPSYFIYARKKKRPTNFLRSLIPPIYNQSV